MMQSGGKLRDEARGGALSNLLLALIVSCLLTMLLWPGLWFSGRSVYSTDAIFRTAPWQAQSGPEEGRQPYNQELGDQDLYFFPQLYAYTKAFREHGDLPLWNPGIYGGVPFDGNVQIAPMSPMRIALPVLSGSDPSPFDVSRALSWLGVLRFVLAFVFAFLWLRRLEVGGVVSLLGASLFAAGPYAMLWHYSTPGQVLAFVPMALYFLERLVRGGSRALLLPLTVALALSHYGGYPQTSLLFVAFLFGYVGFHGEVSRPRGQVLALLACSVFLSGLLAAPLFLPFLSYLQESSIAAVRAAQALFRGTGEGARWIPPAIASVLFLLFTWLFARHRKGPAEYRVGFAGFCFGAACLFAKHGGGDGQALFWLFPGLAGHPLDAGGFQWPLPYIEVMQDHVGLMLAILFVGAAGGRANRVGLLALLSVLILSSGWPLISPLLRLGVPLLEPSRLACLVPPLVSLLFVLAMRRYSVIRGKDRRQALKLGAIAVAAFLFPTGLDHLWWAGLPQFRLLDGAAFFVLLLCLRGAPTTKLFLRAFAAVAVLFALWPAHAVQPSLERSKVYPETEVTRFLEQEKRKDPELRVFATDHSVMPGNSPLVYGLDQVLGWDGFDPSRYVLLASWLQKKAPGLRALWSTASTRLDSKLFDLFAARFVLAKEGTSLPAHFLVRLRAEGMLVAENQRALPRFFLTSKAHVLAGYQDLEARDPRASVALGSEAETRLEGTPMRKGSVEVLLRGANGRYLLRTKTDGAAFLVMLDNLLPGIEARVDQAEVPLLPAWYAFRAIRIPPGEHEVEFRYAAPRFWLGVVSLLVGALLLFYCAFGPIPRLLQPWARRATSAACVDPGLR